MPVVPPPLYAVGAAVLQRRIAPDADVTGARAVVAGGIAAASGALVTAAITRFRSRHTTVEPFKPGQATSLVTDGANALTRNPMYVGMAGALLAHAVALGDWRALAPVAGFIAVIDRVQVRPEEAALRELFGAEYDAYCARVPRWLGR